MNEIEKGAKNSKETKKIRAQAHEDWLTYMAPIAPVKHPHANSIERSKEEQEEIDNCPF